MNKEDRPWGLLREFRIESRFLSNVNDNGRNARNWRAAETGIAKMILKRNPFMKICTNIFGLIVLNWMASFYQKHQKLMPGRGLP